MNTANKNTKPGETMHFGLFIGENGYSDKKTGGMYLCRGYMTAIFNEYVRKTGKGEMKLPMKTSAFWINAQKTGEKLKYFGKDAHCKMRFNAI